MPTSEDQGSTGRSRCSENSRQACLKTWKVKFQEPARLYYSTGKMYRVFLKLKRTISMFGQVSSDQAGTRSSSKETRTSFTIATSPCQSENKTLEISKNMTLQHHKGKVHSPASLEQPHRWQCHPRISKRCRYKYLTRNQYYSAGSLRRWFL